MFKKIKKRIFLRRSVQIEILETLCTICLWLEHQGHYNGNPCSRHMGEHFEAMRALSRELRDMYH